MVTSFLPLTSLAAHTARIISDIKMVALNADKDSHPFIQPASGVPKIFQWGFNTKGDEARPET